MGLLKQVTNLQATTQLLGHSGHSSFTEEYYLPCTEKSKA